MSLPRAERLAEAPPRQPRRRRGALVSALVVAGLVWWFLRGVSLDQVGAQIRGARLPYICAALLVSLGGFAFRIVRWRYLLAPVQWTRLRSLAAAVFVGWAATALLPGRVGEIARAVLIRERDGVRASAALGTIVLERLVDAFAVLMLVAAALGFGAGAALGSPQASLLVAIRTGALVVFAALAGAATVILLMHHVPARLTSLVRRLLTRLPGRLGPAAWGMVEAFGAGLSGAVRRGSATRTLTPGRLRVHVLAHTIGLWAMICAVHVLLLRAFEIDAPVSSVPLLLFLITLGLAVPVPAALGSYHKAVQLGLTTMLGVSPETAAGYAIVSHGVTLGPPALIGIGIALRGGIAFSRITSLPASAQSPVE
jgi:uncharacterized membrane protein YbhN (UPF0104 family)